MLLLKDNQRRIFILPSLNTKIRNNINLDVDYKKDEESNELHQVHDINDINDFLDLHYDIELVDNIQDVDTGEIISKKLVKNMIESII